MTAEDLDMIIVATVTPDYITQSTACLVQNKLGVKQIPCFDVNAACSGFMYALTIAGSMVRGGVYKNILVLGGEVLSRIVDMENRSN